jgi:FixJ family two-component response regulator
MPYEAAAQMEKSRSAMHHRIILILEDDDDRVSGLQSAVASLGWGFGVRIWRDAPTMIAECPACFAKACLISLDHDLEAMAGAPDPGTGLEVAEFLSLHAPMCPVILHTTNFDGRLAMHNKLRAGGWTVATVPPREADWIQTSWLPIAKKLMGL